MVRPCSTSATMFVKPGSVRTTLAAPLATSVAVLTAMPTSAWRSAGASLTPSPVMPVTCPAACRCFTTIYLSSGKYLRETIGAREKIHRLVAGLRARGLQVRHALDVGQPHAARDF